jgi:hypothetical protein
MSHIILRKRHAEGLDSLPAEAKGPGRCLKAAFFPLHGLQTMVLSKGKALIVTQPDTTRRQSEDTVYPSISVFSQNPN